MPIGGRASAGSTRPALASWMVVSVVVALTGLTMLVGFANKARCTGPEFQPDGRSAPDHAVRIFRDVCYSDIQELWIGRGIDNHLFPYIHGSLSPDGHLQGGSVEYPVLTGMLMWAGAVFADNDAEFLLASALLLAPFGLLVGLLLGRLSGWRALIWALGPPLVLYAFHNWELPVVASVVAAVFVMEGWRTQRSLLTRATIAAVLLGLGCALKVYPGAFLLPLVLHVLTANRPGGLDWRAAVRVAAVGAGTVVAVNLPFALVNFEGWWASFEYQSRRPVDVTTGSIWYWGFRPHSDPVNAGFQHWVNVLSPALVLVAFAVAAAVGWWRWRRSGAYPWIEVSAAMLCAFMLLHKVHSPQYTLWLLPFFVILAVPWRWVLAYLAVDLAMGIGIFRWFYQLGTPAGGIDGGLAAQAVVVGVWGRAALLAVLFVVFLTIPGRPSAVVAPPETPAS